MRLSGLRLDDFRRFDRLELLSLDRDLTVIVGPNGAGKSTLFHALNLVNLALSWAGEIDSTAYNELQRYQSALRQEAASKRFAVRVGLEFTEAWETTLWVGFMRAVAASAVAERQPPADLSSMEQFLSTITVESLGPVLAGQLAVAYISGPSPSWLVGYEFTHAGQHYYFGLQGGVFAGNILVGPLPTQPSYGLR